MDPVFVGEAEELRERNAELVEVLDTMGDPVCFADLVKLPVAVDVLEGGELLDKLGEEEEVRVPIEVRVEQGDADCVEDRREDPVIVLLDVPVFDDVVDDVVVFEERPDIVARGEADEVFVIGPVRVFAKVPLIDLLAKEVNVNARDGYDVRVDVVVLVDVFEAVLVGLNATPGSIEFVNTIYNRNSSRRMLLFT